MLFTLLLKSASAEYPEDLDLDALLESIRESSDINALVESLRNARDVQDVPSQLGQGFDMTQFDMWSMQNRGSMKYVLKWGDRSSSSSFPSECLQTADRTDPGCATSIKVDITEYASSTQAVDAWENSFSFGGTGGGGVPGQVQASASLSMAFKNSGSSAYASAKSGVMSETTAHNGCTRILPSCITPAMESPMNLDDYFMEQIALAGEHHLDTEGINEWAMRHWSNNIIGVFGTDVVTGLDHGASIRTSVSNDQNGIDAAFDASGEVCGGVQVKMVPGAQAAAATAGATAGAAASGAAASGAAASGRRRISEILDHRRLPVPFNVNVSMCAGGSRHNAVNQLDISNKKTCTTVGGGGSPWLRHMLCEAPEEATPEDVAEFLNSGFEGAKTSANVINMKTRSLADLWWQYNPSDPKGGQIHATYKKAIEYHSCIAQDEREWDFTTGTCKCNRRCSNHGVVDPDTCTCLCFGNNLHGYKGATCSTAYGKCQAGPNAGDMPNSQKCSSMKDGQQFLCQGRHRNHMAFERCDAGQNCCSTWYSGTCCPYGYTCGHRQYWKRPINQHWANRNQEIYQGCRSGDCSVCIPPQSEWNGVNFNQHMRLSTLFPAGTELPSAMQSITHPSWRQMDYGAITDMGHGVFREDPRAGKEARGVSDDMPEDDLEARLGRLMEALAGLKEEDI